MPVTVAELVMHGDRLLRPSESSRLDAELLLAKVLDRDRLVLYRESEFEVAPPERARFDKLLGERAAGRPVAQLLGEAEFWSLPFFIDADVLVPRPETELLVDTVLERIPGSGGGAMVTDLGTGSGVIAVVVGLERPEATIIAIDRCGSALRTARKNCIRHGISGVHLLRADWLHGLHTTHFDIIVSNPPYVAADDLLLSSSDIRFEPKLALVGGSDGFAAFRAIVSQAPAYLKPGGLLCVEHGYHQGSQLRRLFHNHGFRQIATKCDLAGLERVTLGQKDSRRA